MDTSNPFFKPLGTNGRSCATCHQPANAWSITPAHVTERFIASHGLDPLFRTNDGTNSPTADVSTLAHRWQATSMLRTRGLLRIGIGIPDGAEFELTAVDDPYGFASANELSLFRRPLPATNLRFLSAVMFDARESIQPIAGDLTDSMSALRADLAHQANDATLGHAQAAAPLTPDQQQQIVDFELSLTTAQAFDFAVGSLAGDGALGGPDSLVNQAFFIGINDPLGHNPTGNAFNPSAMSLYAAWGNLSGFSFEPPRVRARVSVARGEAIFNTRPMFLQNVGGLNDALNQPVIVASCTVCHSAPNVGNHSVALALNIGISDGSRRTPDMPLYTLKNKVTQETVQTTDPGRALITGKWADIGKFKGPILRGLAARAPYFHNGSAATIEEVIAFYNDRFTLQLSDQEKADLAAFLRTL